MATLSQMRDRVDSWLAARWPTVVARQQNYFVNRGRYWQGLITHSLLPEHTNSRDGDALADRLAVNPTDQFENWAVVFPEWSTELLPAAIQIDVYDGPAGKGWVATIWVKYNGTIYSRSQNVGPESHRTQSWHVVELENPEV